MRKPASIIGFAAGIVCGLAVYHVALKIGDFTVLSPQDLEQRNNTLAELEEENHELSEELFRPRGPSYEVLDEGELPYDGNDDATSEVATARAAAVNEKKFLMVTFGANWCRDCRNLHRILHTEELEDYTTDLFAFVNVDVGKFNQNKHVAEDLGISLSKGIPVAVFFDPQGQVIGTTNEGELEPARRYSSKQILKFVRDIAERSQISAPDTVD
ncbi:MAG: thioredoxin family protein [Xanthomonadales bacterium]|nr:thioredoxin family protein [Xanthomonadales bacterium]MDH4020372.1 thioredoxin family protein [Xanthomonadales bacterium]